MKYGGQLHIPPKMLSAVGFGGFFSCVGGGGGIESLQPNRYYKSHSYFKHFLGENSFDIINKSHHMDNDENLKTNQEREGNKS